MYLNIQIRSVICLKLKKNVDFIHFIDGMNKMNEINVIYHFKRILHMTGTQMERVADLN